MKSFTKTLFLISVLSVWHTVSAQQWSDVGDPGFTPSNQTLTNPQFAAKLALYNNVPYMAYVASGGVVTVMSYTGGVWSALPATSSGTNCMFIQLAFDASGALYLAYLNSSFSVVVKKFSGSLWSTVGTGPVVQNNLNGLAINPVTNEPYVATYDAGGTSKVTVYRYNGTSWVTVGPADFSGQTQFIRLAITSTGVPYVAMQDGLSGTTFSVMRFDGTNWVNVGGSAIGNLNTFATDIAVDGSGSPYVYSSNASNGKANVLKFNGTAWVPVGQSDFSAGNSAHPFLKFDNTGVLHLAYQDGASANGVNKATVMKFNGTSWVGVGNAGLSGAGVYYPSLAFNSTNQPIIGFRDAATSGAKGTVMKLCASSSASVTSTTPGLVCGTGTATLAATSTGTLRWYNAATNGLFVGTGTTFSTPTLTTTTSYSVAAYDANGCSSARTVVIATVNPVPTITGSTPGSRCGAGTVSLSAIPSAGGINWFTAATGGSSIGTGTSFTTPSISTTTTYIAEANNGGCPSSTRTAVVATIKEVPAVGTGIGTFRCGPGTLNISASAFPTGATLTWFAAASGGSSLGTGNSFTTPSISTTTTYYAEANFNGCVSTSRTPIIAEVRLIPAVTSSADGEVCNEGTISLSATTSTGSQPRWYDVQTGGTSLSSSNNFTTPLLTATKTYYVEALQNGCASTPRTAVAATIKPLPILSVSDVNRCDAGSVSFEAASDGTVSWFAASTGGSALGIGPNYTTPVISVTTPYFVQATLNGCTSLSRTQVQAVIITTPPKPTITQNNSNIEAPVLTSSASADNQWYKDGSLIGGATSVTYTVTDIGEYKVQVNNSGCLSPFSDPVFYIITGAELANDQLLKIFPNPATEELIITLSGFDVNHPVAVAVVDMLGRNMSQSIGKAGGEVKLNVRSLQAGQYIVVAQQGSRKIIKQFIKSN